MLDHLISWAALLFAGISLVVAMRVQRRQPELIAKQIADLDRSARERHEAQLLIRLQREDGPAAAHGLHRLVVSNRGPAEARDIDVRFPDGNSPIPEAEARAKLPIAVLQAGGTVSLVAVVSMDHAPPFHVILAWRDGKGERKQETTLT